jgi:hypothetical protein
MITNISNINGHNIACYLITDEMTKKLRIFMVLVSDDNFSFFINAQYIKRGQMIIYFGQTQVPNYISFSSMPTIPHIDGLFLSEITMA